MLFQNGLVNTNDTFLTAEPLSSQPGYPANTQYHDCGQPRGQAERSTSIASRHRSPRRAARRIDSEPGPDASQRDLAGRLDLRCEMPILSARRSCSTANGSYVVQATGLTPGETYYSASVSAQASASRRQPAITRFRPRFGLSPPVVQPFAGRHTVGIRTRRINTRCTSPKPSCFSSSCRPARTARPAMRR